MFIAPYRPSRSKIVQYRPRRTTILLLLTTVVVLSQWSYAYVEKRIRPLTYAESEHIALVLSNHIDLDTLSAPQEGMLSDIGSRGEIIGGTGRTQFDFPEYIVRTGESLSLIAARYRISVDELVTVNPGISENGVIYIGQVLTIPVEGQIDTNTQVATQTRTTRTTKNTVSVATAQKTAVPIPSSGGFVRPLSYKSKTRGFSRYHPGSDLAADIGTPVMAVRDGCVVYRAPLGSYNGGYGNVLLLDVGEGITALYAHLSGYARGLQEGTCFGAGQIIGYVGSTGRSTGPHLHFEIRRNGVKIDPRILIPGT